MKPETKITSELLKEANKINAWTVYNMHGNTHNNSLPDTLWLVPNFGCWIEFKGPKTELRTNQMVTIRALLNADTPVAIIRFLNDDEKIFSFCFENLAGEVINTIILEMRGRKLSQRRHEQAVAIARLSKTYFLRE